MARTGAQDGDILVTRESRPAVRYAVRQLPGVVQFTASGREEAVKLARGFAINNAVDVWYREAGREYLLGAYRPPAADRIRDREA